MRFTQNPQTTKENDWLELHFPRVNLLRLGSGSSRSKQSCSNHRLDHLRHYTHCTNAHSTVPTTRHKICCDIQEVESDSHWRGQCSRGWIVSKQSATANTVCSALICRFRERLHLHTHSQRSIFSKRRKSASTPIRTSPTLFDPRLQPLPSIPSKGN